MSQATRWSTQFNIQDEMLSGFTREAEAAGADLLQWCLMNGKVPQDGYLDWATRTYELPLVKSDFFTSPPDLELWKKTKELGPWSPTLVPLTEWEGCLFIGCLEPPTDLKLDKRHQFVLASARHLFILWDQLNPSQSTKPSQAASAPQATQSTETKQETQESAVITLGPPPTPETKPEPIEEDLTSPDFSRQMPNETDLNASAAQTSAPSQETSSDDDVALVSFNEPEASAPQPESAGADQVASEAPAPEETAPELVASAPAPSPTPTETAPAGEATIVADATVTMKVAASDEVTAVSDNASAAPPVLVREPRPLEACTSKDDLGAIVNSHILKTFDGAMILSFEKKHLRPWLYSDLFRSEKNNTLPTVEIETPSIFRIVVRTRLPYHGYVTPSPTNDAFFAAYFGGRLPKHATLVPVIVEEELFGILMGVAEKEVDYKNSLIQMERLADEMAQHLVRLKQSNAA